MTDRTSTRRPRPRRCHSGPTVRAGLTALLALGLLAAFLFAAPTLVTGAGPGRPLATPAGVAAVLDPRGEGLGDLTASVVDPLTGQQLWGRSPAEPQVPASTTKVLTAAAVLARLDHDARWTTAVVAGPTDDSVVLVGGGDPTVSSLPAGQQGVYPDAATLDDLVAAVASARAGRPPLRTVYVDVSRYDDEGGAGLADGWDPADVGGGFVAPIVPVMLDGGRADPAASTSPRSTTPARDAARELGRRLAVGGPPPVVEVGTDAPDAPVLGSIASPTMADLVGVVLSTSDNVLAEALGREVARATGAATTFEGAARSVLRAAQDAGHATDGAALADTSGLSVHDRIPAGLLSAVMSSIAVPDASGTLLRPLLDGLPVAGVSGNLEDRFAVGTPAAVGRGHIRAKSGTLSGVDALVGLVDTVDGGTLAFAFVLNGEDPDVTRQRLDELAAALRLCGCR